LASLSLLLLVSCFEIGIGRTLQTRLSPFLANGDEQNEIQPRSIDVLKVPDYFAEYREVGDGYAAFLGSCIVAKVSKLIAYSIIRTQCQRAQISFNDAHSKNFVSKTEYVAKGPRAIIQMSPGLL
jgi:actin-related protein 9